MPKICNLFENALESGKDILNIKSYLPESFPNADIYAAKGTHNWDRLEPYINKIAKKLEYDYELSKLKTKVSKQFIIDKFKDNVRGLTLQDDNPSLEVLNKILMAYTKEHSIFNNKIKKTNNELDNILDNILYHTLNGLKPEQAIENALREIVTLDNSNYNNIYDLSFIDYNNKPITSSLLTFYFYKFIKEKGYIPFNEYKLKQKKIHPLTKNDINQVNELLREKPIESTGIVLPDSKEHISNLLKELKEGLSFLDIENKKNLIRYIIFLRKNNDKLNDILNQVINDNEIDFINSISDYTYFILKELVNNVEEIRNRKDISKEDKETLIRNHIANINDILVTIIRKYTTIELEQLDNLEIKYKIEEDESTRKSRTVKKLSENVILSNLSDKVGGIFNYTTGIIELNSKLKPELIKSTLAHEFIHLLFANYIAHNGIKFTETLRKLYEKKIKNLSEEQMKKVFNILNSSLYSKGTIGSYKSQIEESIILLFDLLKEGDNTAEQIASDIWSYIINILGRIIRFILGNRYYILNDTDLYLELKRNYKKIYSSKETLEDIVNKYVEPIIQEYRNDLIENISRINQFTIYLNNMYVNPRKSLLNDYVGIDLKRTGSLFEKEQYSINVPNTHVIQKLADGLSILLDENDAIFIDNRIKDDNNFKANVLLNIKNINDKLRKYDQILYNYGVNTHLVQNTFNQLRVLTNALTTINIYNTISQTILTGELKAEHYKNPSAFITIITNKIEGFDKADIELKNEIENAIETLFNRMQNIRKNKKISSQVEAESNHALFTAMNESINIIFKNVESLLGAGKNIQTLNNDLSNIQTYLLEIKKVLYTYNDNPKINEIVNYITTINLEIDKIKSTIELNKGFLFNRYYNIGEENYKSLHNDLLVSDIPTRKTIYGFFDSDISTLNKDTLNPIKDLNTNIEIGNNVIIDSADKKAYLFEVLNILYSNYIQDNDYVFDLNDFEFDLSDELTEQIKKLNIIELRTKDDKNIFVDNYKFYHPIIRIKENVPKSADKVIALTTYAAFNFFDYLTDRLNRYQEITPTEAIFLLDIINIINGTQYKLNYDKGQYLISNINEEAKSIKIDDNFFEAISNKIKDENIQKRFANALIKYISTTSSYENVIHSDGSKITVTNNDLLMSFTNDNTKISLNKIPIYFNINKSTDIIRNKIEKIYENNNIPRANIIINTESNPILKFRFHTIPLFNSVLKETKSYNAFSDIALMRKLQNKIFDAQRKAEHASEFTHELLSGLNTIGKVARVQLEFNPNFNFILLGDNTELVNTIKSNIEIINKDIQNKTKNESIPVQPIKDIVNAIFNRINNYIKQTEVSENEIHTLKLTLIESIFKGFNIDKITNTTKDEDIKDLLVEHLKFQIENNYNDLTFISVKPEFIFNNEAIDKHIMFSSDMWFSKKIETYINILQNITDKDDIINKIINIVNNIDNIQTIKSDLDTIYNYYKDKYGVANIDYTVKHNINEALIYLNYVINHVNNTLKETYKDIIDKFNDFLNATKKNNPKLYLQFYLSVFDLEHYSSLPKDYNEFNTLMNKYREEIINLNNVDEEYKNQFIEYMVLGITTLLDKMSKTSTDSLYRPRTNRLFSYAADKSISTNKHIVTLNKVFRIPEINLHVETKKVFNPTLFVKTFHNLTIEYRRDSKINARNSVQIFKRNILGNNFIIDNTDGDYVQHHIVRHLRTNKNEIHSLFRDNGSLLKQFKRLLTEQLKNKFADFDTIKLKRFKSIIWNLPIDYNKDLFIRKDKHVFNDDAFIQSVIDYLEVKNSVQFPYYDEVSYNSIKQELDKIKVHYDLFKDIISDINKDKIDEYIKTIEESDNIVDLLINYQNIINDFKKKYDINLSIREQTEAINKNIVDISKHLYDDLYDIIDSVFIDFIKQQIEDNNKTKITYRGISIKNKKIDAKEFLVYMYSTIIGLPGLDWSNYLIDVYPDFVKNIKSYFYGMDTYNIESEINNFLPETNEILSSLIDIKPDGNKDIRLINYIREIVIKILYSNKYFHHKYLIESYIEYTHLDDNIKETYNSFAQYYIESILSDIINDKELNKLFNEDILNQIKTKINNRVNKDISNNLDDSNSIFIKHFKNLMDNDAESLYYLLKILQVKLLDNIEDKKTYKKSFKTEYKFNISDYSFLHDKDTIYQDSDNKFIILSGSKKKYRYYNSDIVKYGIDGSMVDDNNNLSKHIVNNYNEVKQLYPGLGVKTGFYERVTQYKDSNTLPVLYVNASRNGLFNNKILTSKDLTADKYDEYITQWFNEMDELTDNDRWFYGLIPLVKEGEMISLHDKIYKELKRIYFSNGLINKKISPNNIINLNKSLLFKRLGIQNKGNSKSYIYDKSIIDKIKLNINSVDDFKATNLFTYFDKMNNNYEPIKNTDELYDDTFTLLTMIIFDNILTSNNNKDIFLNDLNLDNVYKDVEETLDSIIELFTNLFKNEFDKVKFKQEILNTIKLQTNKGYLYDIFLSYIFNTYKIIEDNVYTDMYKDIQSIKYIREINDLSQDIYKKTKITDITKTDLIKLQNTFISVFKNTYKNIKDNFADRPENKIKGRAIRTLFDLMSSLIISPYDIIYDERSDEYMVLLQKLFGDNKLNRLRDNYYSYPVSYYNVFTKHYLLDDETKKKLKYREILNIYYDRFYSEKPNTFKTVLYDPYKQSDINANVHSLNIFTKRIFHNLKARFNKFIGKYKESAKSIQAVILETIEENKTGAIINPYGVNSVSFNLLSEAENIKRATYNGTINKTVGSIFYELVENTKELDESKKQKLLYNLIEMLFGNTKMKYSGWIKFANDFMNFLSLLLLVQIFGLDIFKTAGNISANLFIIFGIYYFTYLLEIVNIARQNKTIYDKATNILYSILDTFLIKPLVSSGSLLVSILQAFFNLSTYTYTKIFTRKESLSNQINLLEKYYKSLGKYRLTKKYSNLYVLSNTIRLKKSPTYQSIEQLLGKIVFAPIELKNTMENMVSNEALVSTLQRKLEKGPFQGYSFIDLIESPDGIIMRPTKLLEDLANEKKYNENRFMFRKLYNELIEGKLEQAFMGIINQVKEEANNAAFAYIAPEQKPLANPLFLKWFMSFRIYFYVYLNMIFKQIKEIYNKIYYMGRNLVVSGLDFRQLGHSRIKTKSIRRNISLLFYSLIGIPFIDRLLNFEYYYILQLFSESVKDFLGRMCKHIKSYSNSQYSSIASYVFSDNSGIKNVYVNIDKDLVNNIKEIGEPVNDIAISLYIAATTGVANGTMEYDSFIKGIHNISKDVDRIYLDVIKDEKDNKPEVLQKITSPKAQDKLVNNLRKVLSAPYKRFQKIYAFPLYMKYIISGNNFSVDSYTNISNELGYISNNLLSNLNSDNNYTKNDIASLVYNRIKDYNSLNANEKSIILTLMMSAIDLVKTFQPVSDLPLDKDYINIGNLRAVVQTMSNHLNKEVKGNLINRLSFGGGDTTNILYSISTDNKPIFLKGLAPFEQGYETYKQTLHDNLVISDWIYTGFVSGFRNLQNKDNVLDVDLPVLGEEISKRENTYDKFVSILGNITPLGLKTELRNLSKVLPDFDKKEDVNFKDFEGYNLYKVYKTIEYNREHFINDKDLMALFKKDYNTLDLKTATQNIISDFKTSITIGIDSYGWITAVEHPIMKELSKADRNNEALINELINGFKKCLNEISKSE